MHRIPLDRLVSIVGGQLIRSPEGTRAVDNIAIHSDRLQADSVFFALAGATDGHRFVPRALANGAIAAVVAADRVETLDPDAGPLIVVSDPLAALQAVAGWWRSELSATVIAVVGSNGKTVTKDALVHLAGARGHTFGSPGSYNSQLGVALSVLECPVDAEIAVFEAAATQGGEIDRLRRLLRPDLVVFTNLGTRHQQNFGDRETYARELLAMAAEVPPDGWLLIGEADAALLRLAGASVRAKVLVSNGSEALPRFSVPEYLAQGLLVRVRFPDGRQQDVVAPTPSREVLGDLELALSAAWLLGVESRALLAALADYRPTSTRMEMWRRPNGSTVVGEVATTDSLALSSAIRTAKGLKGPAGRTFVVLADGFDGGAGAAAVPRVAPVLRAEGVDVVCGLRVDAHAAISRALTEAPQGDGGPEVHLLSNVDQMREFLVGALRPEDVALVHVPRDSMTPDAWMQLVEDAGPTRLYVDLAAVQSNVAAFRQLIGPHTKLMGVVKADAYGTNPVHVARCLHDAGADWLGVATTEEGIALRRAGIQMRILVFLAVPDDMDKLIRHHLTPLMYSWDMLEATVRAASRLSRPLEAHLEVDSGMHRTGLYPDAAIEALGRLRDTRQVQLTGLMTHMGCADDPAEDEVTREQLARFQKVSAVANELGFTGLVRHAAATAATVRFPEARFDMVRIGLGLYGIPPSPATTDLITLTPAIGLVSRIIEIHDMAPGDWAGYGGLYRASADGGRICIIPAGYYDSVPRAFRAVGYVLVNGRRCRIAGNISMDSMAIDITGHPDAEVGSDVLIFGTHAGFSLPIEQAADAMGTVSHELLTGVGPRVQRIFTRH